MNYGKGKGRRFGGFQKMILLAAALVLISGFGYGRSKEKERIEKSTEVFKEILELPEEGIPDILLKKAYGIAIIPGVIKAAWGLGGQYGKGVFLRKSAKGKWSNPCFITLAGGSLGWQIGVQKSDIILVFKSEKSVADFEDGKITLGAEAGVTAGPVGRRAEASTDIELEAEIYSYSKSKGLFAGIALSGATIRVDEESNEDFYRILNIDAQRILNDPELNSPPQARKLIRLLTRNTLY